jgi:hypothetical protein
MMPRLFINIEGGIVQSVVSDVPMEIVKIDYDAEGSGPDEGVVEFDQGDGHTAPAFVTIGSTYVDPKEVNRVFEAAKAVE